MLFTVSQSDMLHSLVGMKPTRIGIANRGRTLVIEDEFTAVAIHADGDCCSSSIFDEVLGIYDLLDESPIAKVSLCFDSNMEHGNLKAKSFESKDGFEVFKPFAMVITKESGNECAVLAWNVSNGYYSGEFDVTFLHDHNSAFIEVDLTHMDSYNALHAWDWRNNY